MPALSTLALHLGVLCLLCVLGSSSTVCVGS